MVHDGDDATFINTNLLPGRLGHVEVRPWRVAPAAVVIGEGIVGRAEVRGRHRHRDAWFAPHRICQLAIACNLVALSTCRTVVEQHRAQRRRPRAVARRV